MDRIQTTASSERNWQPLLEAWETQQIQSWPDLIWLALEWARQSQVRAGRSRVEPVPCPWGQLPDGSLYQQFQLQTLAELTELFQLAHSGRRQIPWQLNGLLLQLARAQEQLVTASQRILVYQVRAMDTDDQRYFHHTVNFRLDRPDSSSSGYWDPAGLVCLALRTDEVVPYDVTVDLERSTANGFPGNLWEVKSCGGAGADGIYQTEEVERFQEGLDLASIADGQAETFFIWERLQIEPYQKDERYSSLRDVPSSVKHYYNFKGSQIQKQQDLKLGEGLWYDPRKLVGDVPWDMSITGRASTDIAWNGPVGGQLVLSLVLRPKLSKPISLLQLLGHFPALDRSGLGWTLSEVEWITANGSSIQRPQLSCGPQQPRVELSCPVQESVAALRLTLIQPNFYRTRIAHPFWIETTMRKEKLSGLLGLARDAINGKNTKWSWRRVAPPVSGQTSSESVRGPTALEQALGIAAGVKWGIPAELIGGSVVIKTKEVSGPYWDIFTARRWAIGIRDCQLLVRSYAEQGSIVSHTLVTTQPWRSVGLIVNEHIPASFPQDQVWVRYFIRIGSDGAWQPIRPLDHSQPEDVPDNISFSEAQINVPVQVRIELSRPTDQPNLSPYITSFTLRFVR